MPWKKENKIKYSTNYYPQGDGLEESSNNNLIKILHKMVTKNQNNWHNDLSNALGVVWVTPKVALGNYLTSSSMDRNPFYPPMYIFHHFIYINL